MPHLPSFVYSSRGPLTPVTLTPVTLAGDELSNMDTYLSIHSLTYLTDLESLLYASYSLGLGPFHLPSSSP